MIKAVIFDLDDTLYDYKQIHPLGMQALEEQAAKILPGISKQAFQKAFTSGKAKVKDRLAPYAAGHNRLLYIENALEILHLPPALYALTLYDAYWNTLLNHMRLRDGVLELLEQLIGKNLKLCICSDLTAHIQFRKLLQLQIAQYFSAIVTSEEAGKEKPADEMFALVLQKVGVRPQEALFIGDSMKKDVLGAKKYGMYAIHAVDWQNAIMEIYDVLDSKT